MYVNSIWSSTDRWFAFKKCQIFLLTLYYNPLGPIVIIVCNWDQGACLPLVIIVRLKCMCITWCAIQTRFFTFPLVPGGQKKPPLRGRDSRDQSWRDQDSSTIASTLPAQQSCGINSPRRQSSISCGPNLISTAMTEMFVDDRHDFLHSCTGYGSVCCNECTYLLYSLICCVP